MPKFRNEQNWYIVGIDHVTAGIRHVTRFDPLCKYAVEIQVKISW